MKLEWIAGLAESTRRKARLRNLLFRLRDIGTECGHCDKWLTPYCPKKVVSMGSRPCPEFYLRSWYVQLQQETQAEIKAINS